MNEAVKLYLLFGVVLVSMGIYTLAASRNLLKFLVGMEVGAKGTTLILMGCSKAVGKAALGQSLVITAIVLETVILAILLALIVRCQKNLGSIDTADLNLLKG